MSDVPRHLLVIAPDRSLESAGRIIHMINSYCEAGSKVSVLCPPQLNENSEVLERLLHRSATVFAVPNHLPEGECYDLAHLLGRSLSPFKQRLSSLFFTMATDRRLYQSIESWPACLRRPLQSILDACSGKVLNIRKKALAEGRYWQHYLYHQLPPALYKKYEKPIQLDCYGYFYFIRALQINRSVGPFDAVFCNYIWTLPIGCLIKELLGVSLIFDSHMSGVDYMEDPKNREIARQNLKWLYGLVDRFIHPWTQTGINDDWVGFTRRSGRPKQASQLNIAILYDEASTQTGTVYEHLNAFRTYLPHQLSFIPATISSAYSIDAGDDDLSLFDAVIVHYGVRLSLPDYFEPKLAKRLADFRGLKMLFIQDEYECTETARRWMEKLQFDVVYTCVPEPDRELIYPQKRFTRTEFLPTLTGYVPEVDHIDNYAMPLEERSLVIAYRGRMLPYHYGALAYEKYEIGVQVKRLAKERGIPVDIEVDDKKRIYGADWYRFLGSARATIGTESGSNVFDFDGKLKQEVQQALVKNPQRTFHDIHSQFIAEHEGIVKMNQISPKVFEAIRLRTALVLFEGAYSGVIEPDLHYIALQKDYANIDEVFQKLEDLDYLRTLTDRAYTDIIQSGKYSYRRFVEAIACDIEARVAQTPAIR